MIELTDEPIDVSRVLARVETPVAGAVVLFLGTTRQFTGDRETRSLFYECYPKMATAQLQELESTAHRQWELAKTSVVHRTGHLKIGEVSVAIAVSAPHRQEAFEAGQWLIDSIKKVVPIWKEEHWADGSSEWVHPGVQKHDVQLADERQTEQE